MIICWDHLKSDPDCKTCVQMDRLIRENVLHSMMLGDPPPPERKPEDYPAGNGKQGI